MAHTYISLQIHKLMDIYNIYTCTHKHKHMHINTHMHTYTYTHKHTHALGLTRETHDRENSRLAV